jgi:hypothetical protein
MTTQTELKLTAEDLEGLWYMDLRVSFAKGSNGVYAKEHSVSFVRAVNNATKRTEIMAMTSASVFYHNGQCNPLNASVLVFQYGEVAVRLDLTNLEDNLDEDMDIAIVPLLPYFATPIPGSPHVEIHKLDTVFRKKYRVRSPTTLKTDT